MNGHVIVPGYKKYLKKKRVINAWFTYPYNALVLSHDLSQYNLGLNASEPGGFSQHKKRWWCGLRRELSPWCPKHNRAPLFVPFSGGSSLLESQLCSMGGGGVERGRQMCHRTLRHSHPGHISTTWSPGLQCFRKSLLDGQRWERLFHVLHARMSVTGRDAAHSPWQRFPQSRTAQGCVCQFLLLLSVARSGKSTGM